MPPLTRNAPANAPPDPRPPVGPAPSFCFVLQPEFPLNALVLASEALRIANQNRARELFHWIYASENGEPVRASNGMWMPVDHDLKGAPPADYLLVFEGNLPTQRNSPALLGRLRAAHRAGAVVGGVDTGAFAVAQAGLGDGGEVVLHWEAAAAFAERFPTRTTRDALFRHDGDLVHCAGGVATLDLMLDIIGRLYSPVLATEVANALVHSPRPADARQRVDQPATVGPRSTTDRMLELMESNLDFPLDLAGLAAALGTSPRTVSRECGRRFGEPPMRLYLRIRLRAARNLLFYEEFPVKDVATACGFSYPAVFSRAFRGQFGQTPSEFRRSIRQRQSAIYRPELRRLDDTAGR